MNIKGFRRSWWLTGLLLAVSTVASAQDEGVSEAIIDGEGPGWRALGEADFAAVNCDPDTWSFDGDLIRCTGTPVGVIRTKEPLSNFELVTRWRHLKPAGNSGIFVWSPIEAMQGIEPGSLPRGGIEVQILDNAFAAQYEARTGKTGDWFTTHGDVFAVGNSEMTPFEPISPNGSRSFPSEDRSKGDAAWNHYYVRCINGEVRLWVNGVEVSGGASCKPATGHLCLESEGSPVEFSGLRIRELP